MTKAGYIATLLCCLALCCCKENGETESDPLLTLSVSGVSPSSATISASTVNASHIYLLCADGNNHTSYTTEIVIEEGRLYTDDIIRITGLASDTGYTVFAVAGNDEGVYDELKTTGFTTSDPDAMYTWERSRRELLSWTDLALCYGGSKHRTPFTWDAERFESHVVYADEDGKEHWMFDGFLFIEFTYLTYSAGGKYSYAPGYGGDSAGKEQWQYLIDYWFGSATTGAAALDEAIENAIAKLGTPPFRHNVVMSLPDPIIYLDWSDKSSPTKYWGELDGRELDFSLPDDRVDALKWFIKEVRKKFDEGNYRHLELGGFYYVPEELVSPGDGYSYDLKKCEQLFPEIAEYLHSLNQSISWIPYNRSAGYRKQEKFNLDYVYMQPNYFWNTDRPLARFFSDINTYNLNMELEFDTQMYDGRAEADAHRERFRQYMEGAKANGVYGRKRLAYYMGTNCLNYLRNSASDKDREIFHEFCRFVVNNPLRAK